MRVAEYGLRSVAKAVRVRLVNKGARQPVEYADWQEVINGIRKAVAAARQLPHGPKKDKRLQFYSDAADQCEYMKDIWRNTISHTRRPYSTTEALGVMQRVEAFMTLLSDKMPSIR